MINKTYITFESYEKGNSNDFSYIGKEALQNNEIESIDLYFGNIANTKRGFYRYNLMNGEKKYEPIKNSKLKESKTMINKLQPDRPKCYRQYIPEVLKNGEKIWRNAGGLDLNFNLIKSETDIFEKSRNDILLLREVTMKNGNVYYYLLSKN